MPAPAEIKKLQTAIKAKCTFNNISTVYTLLTPEVEGNTAFLKETLTALARDNKLLLESLLKKACKELDVKWVGILINYFKNDSAAYWLNILENEVDSKGLTVSEWHTRVRANWEIFNLIQLKIHDKEDVIFKNYRLFYQMREAEIRVFFDEFALAAGCINRISETLNFASQEQIYNGGNIDKRYESQSLAAYAKRLLHLGDRLLNEKKRLSEAVLFFRLAVFIFNNLPANPESEAINSETLQKYAKALALEKDFYLKLLTAVITNNYESFNTVLEKLQDNPLSEAICSYSIYPGSQCEEITSVSGTLLHQAAKSCQDDARFFHACLRIMDIDVNQTNGDNRTALDVALESQNALAYQLLWPETNDPTFKGFAKMASRCSDDMWRVLADRLNYDKRIEAATFALLCEILIRPGFSDERKKAALPALERHLENKKNRENQLREELAALQAAHKPTPESEPPAPFVETVIPPTPKSDEKEKKETIEATLKRYKYDIEALQLENPLKVENLAQQILSSAQALRTDIKRYLKSSSQEIINDGKILLANCLLMESVCELLLGNVDKGLSLYRNALDAITKSEKKQVELNKFFLTPALQSAELLRAKAETRHDYELVSKIYACALTAAEKCQSELSARIKNIKEENDENLILPKEVSHLESDHKKKKPKDRKERAGGTPVQIAPPVRQPPSQARIPQTELVQVIAARAHSRNSTASETTNSTRGSSGDISDKDRPASNESQRSEASSSAISSDVPGLETADLSSSSASVFLSDIEVREKVKSSIFGIRQQVLKAFSDGNYEKADELLNEIIQRQIYRLAIFDDDRLRLNLAEFYSQRGLANIRLGKYDDAYDFAQLALKILPVQPRLGATQEKYESLAVDIYKNLITAMIASAETSLPDIQYAISLAYQKWLSHFANLSKKTPDDWNNFANFIKTTLLRLSFLSEKNDVIDIYTTIHLIISEIDDLTLRAGVIENLLETTQKNAILESFFLSCQNTPKEFNDWEKINYFIRLIFLSYLQKSEIGDARNVVESIAKNLANEDDRPKWLRILKGLEDLMAKGPQAEEQRSRVLQQLESDKNLFALRAYITGLYLKALEREPETENVAVIPQGNGVRFSFFSDFEKNSGKFAPVFERIQVGIDLLKLVRSNGSEKGRQVLFKAMQDCYQEFINSHPSIAEINVSQQIEAERLKNLSPNDRAWVENLLRENSQEVGNSFSLN